MSRLYRVFVAAGLVAVLICGSGKADPSALAQLGPGGAVVEDAGGTVVLSVPLSQAVPWRIAAVDGPPRIVVEFSDIVWSSPPDVSSASIAEARVERQRPGWSQLELLLREPLTVASAEMATEEDGTAALEVRLRPTTGEDFRLLTTPNGVEPPATLAAGGQVVVAIDPGHGGIDPGAMADGLVEADLMLQMARRLKEALLRTGHFDVVLTREEDVFVPLEARLTRARSAGAEVFLSLHADALPADEGPASGVTVYRFSEDATDRADNQLAERHAASDLLTGVDLTGAGDDVALALLDMARRDTLPRSRALQRALVQSFEGAGFDLHSRPERHDALAVLKSAEIPSVLIELGFLSSETDRTRLSSEDWQQDAAQSMAEALLRWVDEDRLRREAMRR